MPGKRSGPSTPLAKEQRKLLWEQGVSPDQITVLNWEPRGDEVIAAILEVLATGSAVFIRPGSGGRAVGVAIWEGDVHHPATWCYDDEELNMWAAGIIRRAASARNDRSE